jgi:hypothetical protein
MDFLMDPLVLGASAVAGWLFFGDQIKELLKKQNPIPSPEPEPNKPQPPEDDDPADAVLDLMDVIQVVAKSDPETAKALSELLPKVAMAASGLPIRAEKRTPRTTK